MSQLHSTKIVSNIRDSQVNSLTSKKNPLSNKSSRVVIIRDKNNRSRTASHICYINISNELLGSKKPQKLDSWIRFLKSDLRTYEDEKIITYKHNPRYITSTSSVPWYSVLIPVHHILTSERKHLKELFVILYINASPYYILNSASNSEIY